jgi:hypothetical protein
MVSFRKSSPGGERPDLGPWLNNRIEQALLVSQYTVINLKSLACGMAGRIH